MLSFTASALEIDFTKCKLYEVPIYTKLPCSSGCNDQICSMKVQCDVGAGPFQIELMCKAVAINKCPDIAACAVDMDTRFSKAYNSNFHSGMDGTGESGTKTQNQ